MEDKNINLRKMIDILREENENIRQTHINQEVYSILIEENDKLKLENERLNYLLSYKFDEKDFDRATQIQELLKPYLLEIEQLKKEIKNVRFINTDIVKKVIHSYMSLLGMGFVDNLETQIDKISTSYDLEKVAEELKKISIKYKDVINITEIINEINKK